MPQAASGVTAAHLHACMWEFSCGAAPVPARVAEELRTLPPRALSALVRPCHLQALLLPAARRTRLPVHGGDFATLPPCSATVLAALQRQLRPATKCVSSGTCNRSCGHARRSAGCHPPPVQHLITLADLSFSTRAQGCMTRCAGAPHAAQHRQRRRAQPGHPPCSAWRECRGVQGSCVRYASVHCANLLSTFRCAGSTLHRRQVANLETET